MLWYPPNLRLLHHWTPSILTMTINDMNYEEFEYLIQGGHHMDVGWLQRLTPLLQRVVVSKRQNYFYSKLMSSHLESETPIYRAQTLASWLQRWLQQNFIKFAKTYQQVPL